MNAGSGRHRERPSGSGDGGGAGARRRDHRHGAHPVRGGRRLAGLDIERAAVRLTVVVAMVVTTAAFAVAGRPAPAAASLSASVGPSAVEVLAAPGAAVTPPDALRAVTSIEGADLTSRSLEAAASRGADRTSVSGCSGIVPDIGTNGQLPEAALCDLWQAPYRDRADAVVSLYALNDAYRAEFGRDMCLSSGYRDLEEQAALRARKGGLAAPAGTSNHGWGLAVDLCDSTYAGAAGARLHDVGPAYGWANPAWAHRGGYGPYEPWHWEYTEAVAAIEAATGGD